MYIDGVSIGTTNPGFTTLPADNGINLAIGENLGAAGREWNGWITEAFVISTTLSQAWIDAQYKSVKDTGFTSYGAIETPQ